MCNIQNSNNVKENKFPDLETVEIDSSRGTSRLFNSDRGLIPLADRWNRNVISNITHQVASDNLKFYREGKISGVKLFRRLKLLTVGGGHLMTLLRYLQFEQDNEFVKWYTFGKVKDFFYDEFEQSIIERSSTNIAIGLVTLPRNAVEACYYQVTKPIVDGVYLKDLEKVYEGIENFVGILVGLYVVLFCCR